jgi:regulator of sigma E protease
MQVLPLPETIVLFVVILGILVLVHELGHFVTAKWFGVEAPEFGIGFPPRLVTLWRTGGWIQIQGKKIQIPRNFPLPPGPAASAFGGENHPVEGDASNPASVLTIGSHVTFKTRAEKGREVLAELHVVPPEQAEASFASQVQHIDRGTEFTLNALPVGGFVRLSGEDDPTAENALAARPAWQRAIVLVAGVTMNFVLALLAFFVLAATFPQPIVGATTQVTGFTPNSPAAQAGVRVGDVITSVNGVNVRNNREEMLNVLTPICGHSVQLGIERVDPKLGAQNLTLNLTPQPTNELPCALGVTINQQIGERITNVAPGSLGAQLGLKPGDGLASVGDFQLVPQVSGPNVEMQSVQALTAYLQAHSQVQTTLPVQVIRDGVPLAPMKVTIPANISAEQATLGLQLNPYLTLPEAAGDAMGQMGAALSVVPRSLVGIVSSFAHGQDSGVGGPIRIAQAVAEGTPQGGLPFIIILFGTLSLNLAILNLLPFPGLDGGRLAFVILEVLRGGRKVDPRIEGIVHLVGIMVLLAFILFVSYNDVLRLIAGKSAFAP